MNAPKSGNPGIVPGEIQRHRAINLSNRLADIARQHGGGNVSRGIRNALEFIHTANGGTNTVHDANQLGSIDRT